MVKTADKKKKTIAKPAIKNSLIDRLRFMQQEKIVEKTK